MRAVSYRRAAGVPFRRMPDSVILATSNDFVSIDGTGAAIWDFLDEPRTAAELTQQLSMLFQGSKDRILADVRGLLRRLVAVGAVERVERRHD